MPNWTFLTNHALVLSLIARNPSITALELASAIGITERAVRRVIAELHDGGYIRKKKAGRGIRYGISPDLQLRHETHQDVALGDFLEALGWKRKKRSRSLHGLDG